MFKLVRRGIVANLGRLALTLVSVVLGVAFVSGSFVLADSLRSIFSQIAVDAFAGVDAQVRAVVPEVQSSDTALIRFDDSVIDEVAALPDVEYAEGGLFAFEQVYSLDAEGEPNRPAGPPVFTSSWAGPSPASSFNLLEGAAPVGQQVALDSAQVESAGFTIGQTVTMSLTTGEPEEFELTGIIDFGDGGTAGAYFNLFDLPTAQRILGAEGVVDSIVINAVDGTSTDDLVDSVAPVLPSGLEVVPAETVIGEQQDAFGAVVSIFGNVLLGFAIVVLFVSIFIIYNTFAILVGQRTRQLGLLRSVGASSNQIRLIVLFESVIIGIIASVIGLFGGLGVAWLLKQLFSTGGNSFPDGPLELRLRTILVVMIVGLIVTVGSALIPAFRAAKVAPLEAIRDGGRKERTIRFRLIAGAIVLVPGLILLALGMFADISDTAGRLFAIGIGAALTFIGVSMMSALFAAQASQVIGRDLFVAAGSVVVGILLIIGSIGLFFGGIFTAIGGFVVENFLPGGLLLIIAGLLLLPIAFIFIASGIPALVDGFGQFKSLVGGGASRTLVNLARDNASRNPQRTAATSTALMIGLALITGVAVLTASLLATFDKLLEDALTADLFVFEENQGLDFSPTLVDDLDALPETETVAAFAGVEAFVDGDVAQLAAFDTHTGSEVVNIDVSEGFATISAEGIGVYSEVASDKGLSIGSPVSVEFEDGFSTELMVEAIFEDQSVASSDWVISRELSRQHVFIDGVSFIGVTFPEGADVESSRAAVESVTANFPQLAVQDNTEFQEQVEGQISQLQNVINGLLVLCLVVAFFGIVNTMALSVLDRTREIGLLRAVGTTRWQLRSAIRSEALIVSIFGAVLGVLMGLLLGWAAVVAIPDSFISTVGIPWFQLVIYLVVGAMIGVIAAYFPARRASNLDVLDAIAHE